MIKKPKRTMVNRITNNTAVMPVVYVAGPYRGKDNNEVWENIQRARTVALWLWQHGYAVMCPHMNAALMDGPLDEVVIQGDIELMLRCDVVVVVPNWIHSLGTQDELEVCNDEGIPFFYFETEQNKIIQYVEEYGKKLTRSL